MVLPHVPDHEPPWRRLILARSDCRFIPFNEAYRRDFQAIFGVEPALDCRCACGSRSGTAAEPQREAAPPGV